jgi:lysozyme family protein
MASFELYYPKLKKYEGGYASDAYAKKMGDSGGETYKGIARNYNKDWAGWKIIDAYKAKNGEPKYNTYIKDATLDALAKEHSKKVYWDAMRLDEVKNQALAEFIGDYGFNSGVASVSKYTNRFVGLPEKTVITSDTIKAINNADQKKLFDSLQAHRIDLITNSNKIDPKNKVGLLARAKSFVFDATEFAKEHKTATVVGLGFFFWIIVGVVVYIVYRNRKQLAS